MNTHKSRGHIWRISPAVSADNHQGSHFLSIAFFPFCSNLIHSSSLRCECIWHGTSSKSWGFRAWGLSLTLAAGQSSSSDTEGSTLSRRQKVISGARRFPRLLLTRCFAPQGRRQWELMIGDGAFEQHSFRRETAVVVAAINGGRPRCRRLAGPVSF